MKRSSCSPIAPAARSPNSLSPTTTPQTVTEICRRLDGMPLAIELAAARVRALTLDEILDGLHDRFRLLTGGARRAVRRQQTLHASVDWSHALLTETERVLFRRLAVFLGGFDLRRLMRSPVTPAWSAIRFSTNSPCSWTSRCSSRKTAAAERDTDCWRPFASMRWRNSANPAKPTSSATATGITTRRWRPSSMRRRCADHTAAPRASGDRDRQSEERVRLELENGDTDRRLTAGDVAAAAVAVAMAHDGRPRSGSTQPWRRIRTGHARSRRRCVRAPRGQGRAARLSRVPLTVRRSPTRRVRVRPATSPIRPW